MTQYSGSLLTIFQKPKFLLALHLPSAYHEVGSMKEMNTLRNEGLIKLPKTIGKRHTNSRPADVPKTILNAVQYLLSLHLTYLPYSCKTSKLSMNYLPQMHLNLRRLRVCFWSKMTYYFWSYLTSVQTTALHQEANPPTASSIKILLFGRILVRISCGYHFLISWPQISQLLVRLYLKALS